MFDFLYLQDYGPDAPPTEKRQSRNPSAEKGSDEIVERLDVAEDGAIAEDVTGFEEDNVEHSVDEDKEQVDGASIHNCAVPTVRSMDGSFESRLLTLHSQMYVLGSKYHIPSLQAASLSKFETAAKHDWKTNDLATAIPIVFGHTPGSDRSMRHCLTQIILKHLSRVLEDRVVVNAIEQVEGLVMTLLREKTLRHHCKITCGFCGISEARRCAHSSSKRSHSFVSCNCESREYCDTCPSLWGASERY